MSPSVWLIAGPTASGKSALALHLAELLGGAEIVNADSMQLYAGLEVLSAAPNAQDRATAPHHLYGVADAADAWSVGRWLRAADPLLERLAGQRRHAVVVGGTGLYFRALTEGLAEVPQIEPNVRAEAVERLEAFGETAFRAELAGLDPQAQTAIATGDRQRLVRAWAVATATGRPLSAWQATTRPLLAPGRYAAVVVEPPRAALYAACDRRLERMATNGALAEVTALLARGLPPDLPAMKALGVREFAAHLSGSLPLPEAIAAAQMQTRRYAKRQVTWFRNQTPHWPRITADAAGEQRAALDRWVETARPA